MGYGLFSRFYDASLEKLYRDARVAAADALQLGGGERVLDAPCGTGQSLDALVAGVGPTGEVVGVDVNAGMLRVCRQRIERAGWANVTVQQADLATYDAAPFDRLHVFLGLSVVSDPAAVFAHVWSLLRPGGRCVIVDVFADRVGLQGRLVNWTAGADIRRRSWELLEQVASDFSRRDLPSKWQHGGTLFLAAGTKG